jgi:DNA-binding beta-propeller fold protein YncE
MLQTLACGLVVLALFAAVDGPAAAKSKKKGKKGQDPYAAYVWPPPPDEPRIKLEAVFSGRADVEARSKFKRRLLRLSGDEPYGRLVKPFDVAFDPQGRIVVTDWASGALFRFDLENRRMDVFGTRGAMRLRRPMGLTVASDGIAYVADGAQAKVLAFDAHGKPVGAYGHQGDLLNPTNVAISPDGSQLFVADSKAHAIVVFDLDSGDAVRSFGRRGSGQGAFNYPTSLAFGPEGELFVVDQLNTRVQVFDADGAYVDEFGNLGTGFGNFVRPKNIAVDEVGLIYVTDNAFNNVQLFDTDFTLLTFVGEGGRGPGRFHGASGIAVQGDRFAVVEQLGARVQVFRFLVPKDR